MITSSKSPQSDPLQTVLFITVDALRYDAIESMPAIRDLASRNLSVENCYSVGSGTTTAMPGIMQSRLATDFKSIPVPQPLTRQSPTLTEQLNRGGWTCSGWHSNPYTGTDYGFDRGFDLFEDLFETGDGEDGEDPSTKDRLATPAERFQMKPYARRLYRFVTRKSSDLSDTHARAEILTDAACEHIQEADESDPTTWTHIGRASHQKSTEGRWATVPKTQSTSVILSVGRHVLKTIPV